MSDLEHELTRFDAQAPIEAAWTPPASWYVDEDVMGRERGAVFGRNWQVVARREELEAPGSFVAGSFADEPYVLVRGKDGTLRGFFNVCRHKGTALVGDTHACVASAATLEAPPRRLREFVCPYHGWTYALDGSLLRAPEAGGMRDFDRTSFGLVPIAVETFGPNVWACLDGKPRSLQDDLAPLRERLEATSFGSLVFAARKTYEIACNWKVYVDNYLDGGYHVAHLHKGLAAQLDLKTYRTEIFERYSIQSSSAGVAARIAGSRDFAERIGDGALYAWIYPNFMINRYGPVMDTNLVLPTGVDTCITVMDYYFEEIVERDGFIERALESSDVVQEEDVAICESVQRGLRSSAYDRGRYSALREGGELHFHRLLAADLRG